MSELSKVEEPTLDAEADNEIELIDLLIIWAKRKKFIVGFTVFVALSSVFFVLGMTNIYQSTIRILPPLQSQSNAAAIMAQLGGLAGGVAAGIARNPNDIYVAMIKSRTVADAVVNRFNLMSVYKSKLREQARGQLEGNTRVQNGKDGVISIDVKDTDPKRASMIANAYGDELLKLARSIALTQASQTRLFFEQQLKMSKDRLAQEEDKLKAHLQSNGVISVDSESRALIEMAARFRAQLAAKEIQVAAMKPFVTENNAEYKRHIQELLSTKEELRKLENGQGKSKSTDKNASSNEGLGSMQLLRDVKYYQMLYEILSRQYEASRLEEARDMVMIQVLDKALEPEVKIAPKRTVIVLTSTVAAFILALLVSLILEYGQKIKGRPGIQQKIATLKNHLIGVRRV